MRDFVSDTLTTNAALTVAATATVTGAGVDIRGFDAANVKFITGIGGITFDGTNNISLRIQHSDDNSTFTACGASDIIPNVTQLSGLPDVNGQVRLINVAHAAPSVTVAGYTGGKRYIRGVAFFNGTHATGTPIAINVQRAAPGNAPV